MSSFMSDRPPLPHCRAATCQMNTSPKPHQQSAYEFPDAFPVSKIRLASNDFAASIIPRRTAEIHELRVKLLDSIKPLESSSENVCLRIESSLNSIRNDDPDDGAPKYYDYALKVLSDHLKERKDVQEDSERKTSNLTGQLAAIRDALEMEVNQAVSAIHNDEKTPKQGGPSELEENQELETERLERLGTLRGMLGLFETLVINSIAYDCEKPLSNPPWLWGRKNLVFDTAPLAQWITSDLKSLTWHTA